MLGKLLKTLKCNGDGWGTRIPIPKVRGDRPRRMSHNVAGKLAGESKLGLGRPRRRALCHCFGIAGTAHEQICKRFANGWSAGGPEWAIELCSYWCFWSERRDLNSGPPVPQTGALTGLRYAPPMRPDYSDGLPSAQHALACKPATT